jgi:NAD-dependent deacetylase
MIEAAIRAIRNARPRNVVVFTGAGVSADSGIPTFRGPGGLWRDFRPEELATPEAFRRDPKLVWEWYEWRRDLIRNAKPNAAHEAIACLPDAVVVTQNVDNLHEEEIGGADRADGACDRVRRQGLTEPDDVGAKQRTAAARRWDMREGLVAYVGRLFARTAHAEDVAVELDDIG